MASMARRNFHVPLSPETYAALREEAEECGLPATAIVREAVETWIDRRRSERMREEIASYVAESAGTRDDLDPELERAAAAHLRSTVEKA